MNLDGENILSLSSNSKGDVLNKISKIIFNKDSAFNNPNRYRFRFSSEPMVYPVDCELFHQCFVENEISIEEFLKQCNELRFDDIDKPMQRGNSPFEHEVASRFTSALGRMVHVTALNGPLKDDVTVENSRITIECGNSEIDNIPVKDIPLLIDALNEVLMQSSSEIEKISAQNSRKYIYTPSIIPSASVIASA